MIPDCKICLLPLTCKQNKLYWKCSRCLSSIEGLPPDQVPTSRYSIQFYENLEAQKESITFGQYNITYREHNDYVCTVIGKEFWDKRVHCINLQEIARLHEKVFDLMDLPATEAKLKLILTFL